MKIFKPDYSDLSEYYQTYFSCIPEDDLLHAFEKQVNDTHIFLKGISGAQSEFAYEEGKWSIREVLGHLCDTERILVYRALRFARNDNTGLPGFDENAYVRNANFSTRSWASLVEEKLGISQSSLIFFRNLPSESFDYSGIANKTPVSVRALMYFILAHERHHLSIIKERYLNRLK
jgi:hypothetical protein